jgi:TPR repeat protein
MKQGRTPDRVHVVRPPQDDYLAQNTAPTVQPRDTRALEIVRTLAQISDKLKRSEAERYELLAELREYRKSLNELEDKADKSEKAYLTLENKIKNRDTVDSEATQRQLRFERALKEAESKLVQAAAGQTLLDKRLKDTEDRQVEIGQRLDTSVAEQASINRQIEKVSQDKSRMLRKVERMEEIITETQDALKARALVLLTDQSAAAQAGLPQIPAWSENNNDIANETAPWWRKSVRMQGVGMASLVVASLLFGWTINQIQQPEIPSIAVFENGGVARVNLQENRWEPISAGDKNLGAEKTLTPVVLNNAEPSTVSEQTPAAQAALDASDEQLMAALEEDPDALAAQLNEIAPQVGTDDIEMPSDVTPSTSKGNYNPLAPFAGKAFTQEPQTANLVAKEKGRGTVSERMASDAALPDAIKKLEAQAFAGVPEAQHDLAAIYTAGRGGVTQNFEKAAFWFREAADQDIGNAAYNLGVLYHQGLGVQRDINRALYWYRSAAALGHPEAQYNLGIAHIEGIGTDYDAPLAAAFFESSANQGVVEAAYNLGLIYENGLMGGNAKTEDALLWYKIAADGGSNDAKAALQQLASSLQIGMKDVNKMVERMQSIYVSTHGRKAGPDKAASTTASASSIPNSSTATAAPNRAIVAQIQELLKEKGLYAGTADGMTGPQTVEAIRAYQAGNSMKVTGLATQDLLAHMLKSE